MNEANYMPSVAQVQTVIDTLRLGVSGGGRLDMSEVFVFSSSRLLSIDHACGTVHCHAGFYSLGAIMSGKLPDAAEIIKSGVGQVPFSAGAEQMARDLGVPGWRKMPLASIVLWAEAHPEIWGNERGHEMFAFRMAFYHPTKRPDGAEHPQHIIDHWCEVRDRIAAVNQSDARAAARSIWEQVERKLKVESADRNVGGFVVRGVGA